MRLLQAGDQVALVACSNGLKEAIKEKVQMLCRTLENSGLKVFLSPCLYEKNGWTEIPEVRAKILMDCFRNDKIKGVFDVSGGDLAIELLPYLDFEEMKRYAKPFFGYSDLTVLLNAIYVKTGQSTCLYQIRNLEGREKYWQRKAFLASCMRGEKDLYRYTYDFWQGESMKGILTGGNIRCFLKLAGTEYFPDLTGKILFLEARRGERELIASLLNQLKLLGAFRLAAGVLFGTFTELDEQDRENLEKIVQRLGLPEKLPVARTLLIGHGTDSRAIWIGRELDLTRS